MHLGWSSSLCLRFQPGGSRGESFFRSKTVFRTVCMPFSNTCSDKRALCFSSYPTLLTPLQVVLSANNNLKKSDVYKLLYRWLGTGLLTSWGDKWKSRRKLLTPAFHFKILEQFVPMMNDTARTLVDVMRMESVAEGHSSSKSRIITDLRGIIL